MSDHMHNLMMLYRKSIIIESHKRVQHARLLTRIALLIASKGRIA